ncbi:MAG: 30S ribosomal protein S3, partial [Candidatus Thermoplasmatota archaeon]
MASERKFVTEKVRRVLLKEFVQARVTRAGFGGLDVQRTPMGTRVTLITERPGLVIGRRGEAIKSLTKAIEDDFKFSNPQIEVQEVENPNLNAQIMAEKLANALERGWHFRRAGHSTVRRIMESGARGCQVVISGKLTGQRHRTEKFKDGHIKYCGQAKLDFMHNGFAVAKLKPGVIGVTVRIMDPRARLPDEIDIIPPKQVEAPAAPAAPAPDAKEEEKKVDEAVQELKKTAEEPK